MAGGRAVVLVVVLVLAGCGGATDATDREPYSVDEPVEPGADELLPGLTEEEVTDPDALHAAHYDGLEDEAYEMTVTVVESTGSETADSYWRTSRTATANGSPAFFLGERWVELEGENRTDESAVEEQIWLSEQGAYGRYTNETGVVSYSGNVDTDLLEPTPPISPVTFYENAETVEVSGDGVRLEAVDATLDQYYRNVSFTVILDEAGYVSQYRLTRTVGSTTVEQEMTLETIEDPDLTEPEWLEEAKAETESEDE